MHSLPRDAGARAPLLDRLVDERGSPPVEEWSRRVLRGPELLASIERELSRLLNTRKQLPENAPEAVSNTVLGYGLRDFTGRYSRDPAVMRLLKVEIEEAIGRFEPRLRDVHVELEAMPGSATELFVRIAAILRASHMQEPVAFRIALQPPESGRR